MKFLLLVLLLLVSCNAEEKGLNRKFVGTTQDELMKSVAPLKDELTEDELTKVQEALESYATRWALAQAFDGGDSADLTAFWNHLNGMTVSEVVKNSEEFAADNPEAGSGSVTKIQFGVPFTVDNMELVLSKPRLAELIPSNEYVDVPKGKQLIFDITVKNMHDGIIVTLMDQWGNALLQDNFENVYQIPDGVRFFETSFKGSAGEVTVKPSETIKDQIVISEPLENAKSFSLIIDPKFVRKKGAHESEELSQDAFSISFERSDIDR